MGISKFRVVLCFIVGPRQSTSITETDTLVEMYKIGLHILQLCTTNYVLTLKPSIELWICTHTGSCRVSLAYLSELHLCLLELGNNSHKWPSLFSWSFTFSVSAGLCVPTYHMCNNYVMYIVAM